MATTKKDLLALVKEAKASGDHPADWFKGYTRMDADALEALLSRVETAVPERAPERPAAVQVAETFVGKFRGNPHRRFIRGTLFRGETAWELWATHRGHLIQKD